MFGSGNMTLIISNEEMNDVMKSIESLEESGLLIKGVSETIKTEAKEQKGGFLSVLLRTLGVSWSRFLMPHKQILKYKSVIKINLNLMVFIQEIIYQK